MKRFLTLITVALCGVLLFGRVESAQALFVRLPGGWEADILLCRDGYLVQINPIILAAGDITEVNVVSSTIPAEIGQVLAVGPFGADTLIQGSKAFRWNDAQPVGTVVTNIQVNRLVGGSFIVRDADAPDTIQNCYLFGGPAAGGVFLGDPQILVLVLNSTAILDAPGGNVIGTMSACKTGFVLETQDDYYKIAVMGGWISVSDTILVARDFGQPGGASYAPCA